MSADPDTAAVLPPLSQQGPNADTAPVGAAAPAKSGLRDIHVACLIGKKPIRTYPWVAPSLSSFNRIKRLASVTYISDGTLSGADVAATPLTGVVVEPSQEEIVAEFLAKYPHIAHVRKLDFTWRKLIDPPLICKTEFVLLCDSDIFVRGGVSIPTPSDRGSIVYLREDIPAYKAKAFSVFREPIVRSCNAGFILYRPSEIDFEFLEFVCKRYIPNMQYLWWSEQFAWAVLAARMPFPAYWEGASARVVSGLASRTDAEMSENVVRWLPRKQPIQSESDLLKYAGSAPVVHLAGNGKPFFAAISTAETPLRDAQLAYSPDRPLGRAEQAILAMRLLYKNTRDRIGERRQAPQAAAER
jgi:hypothetical protein